MGFCGDDNINTSRGRQYANKSSESRANNTRNELIFLAQAYYDCAQFVFNSGFRDISIVNNQFNNMLATYVGSGKIKRESYNKFMELAVGIDITRYTKPVYVNTITEAFDNSTALGDKFRGGRVRKDFKEFMRGLGLNIGKDKEDIIYLQLMFDIAAATGNSAIKELATKQRSEMGMTSIEFKGPQTMVSDGDGCGHGVRYGNALEYFDKVNIRRS